MEIKNFSFQVKDVAADGTVEGYASTFGNIDLTGDRIEKGAFKRTINAHKGKLPVLYGHRTDQIIGKGVEMREDAHGLWVKARLLVDKIGKAAEVFELVKEELIRSFSIGYEPVKFEYVTEKGRSIRVLTEIKLLEYSLVLFPANPAAEITGAKAEDIESCAHLFYGLPEPDLDAALAQVKSLALPPHQAHHGDPGPTPHSPGHGPGTSDADPLPALGALGKAVEDFSTYLRTCTTRGNEPWQADTSSCKS